MANKTTMTLREEIEAARKLLLNNGWIVKPPPAVFCRYCHKGIHSFLSVDDVTGQRWRHTDTGYVPCNPVQTFATPANEAPR